MTILADISVFEKLQRNANWSMMPQLSLMDEFGKVVDDSGNLFSNYDSDVGKGPLFQSIVLEQADSGPNVVIRNMTPKVLPKYAPSFCGYRFYTYRNEDQYGGKLEPKHIHVATPDGKAKFWLESGDNAEEVTLAENDGVPEPMVNDIKKHIKKNRQGYINYWVEEVERPYNEQKRGTK